MNISRSIPVPCFERHCGWIPTGLLPEQPDWDAITDRNTKIQALIKRRKREREKRMDRSIGNITINGKEYSQAEEELDEINTKHGKLMDAGSGPETNDNDDVAFNNRDGKKGWTKVYSKLRPGELAGKPIYLTNSDEYNINGESGLYDDDKFDGKTIVLNLHVIVLPASMSDKIDHSRKKSIFVDGIRYESTRPSEEKYVRTIFQPNPSQDVVSDRIIYEGDELRVDGIAVEIDFEKHNKRTILYQILPTDITDIVEAAE